MRINCAIPSSRMFKPEDCLAMVVTNIFFIVLHITSVFAGVAAAIFWLRSADIKIPAISPPKKVKGEEASLSADWINQLSDNLHLYRKQSLLATKYNKAAASSAAIAALAQAVVYLLNIVNLLA